MVKQFLLLRDFQLGQLNNTTVKLVAVSFDDGTKWEQGGYYRPNPGVTGGFDRINQVQHQG